MTRTWKPTLRIRRSALREMTAHAREEAPNECCGLLIGRAGYIARVERARNLRLSPTRYLVDPEDHFRAIRRARDERLEVVGAYHSHPDGPPDPSPTDIDEAADPGFIHLIISLRATLATHLRAHHIRNGRAEPLELRLASETAGPAES